MTSRREPHQDHESHDDGPQVYAVSIEGGRARFDRRAFIGVGATGSMAVAVAACGGSTDDDAPAEPAGTTGTAAPTTAPLTFEENFDGALGEGWSWWSEDPNMWSLTATPGWLQITAVGARQNVLVRDAPHDRHEITTALRFRPTSNYQFAGLIVGEDETNYLQLGRAYCNPVAATDCVGDGVYLDEVENDEVLSHSIVNIALDTEVLYLRFAVDGDSYAGYVSEDGETWAPVGVRNRSFTGTQIGLIAHQAFEAPAVAEFDSFTVTSPSDWAVSSTTTTTVPLQDGTVPPGETGIELDIDGQTYTLPCGSPIPAGAICTCNCVDVPSCGCVGHTTCSCVGDTGCSCVGDTACGTVSHYWYPN